MCPAAVGRDTASKVDWVWGIKLGRWMGRGGLKPETWMGRGSENPLRWIGRGG